MNIFLGILGILLILTIIVSLHELGHLIAAKKFGVYCDEYAIGMGSVIWQYPGTDDPELQTKGMHKLFKETTFSIRWLPIGGYVSMAGETDLDPKEIEEVKSDPQDPLYWQTQVPEEKHLNNKKCWQQTIVMLAGVAVNIVLAIVCFQWYALTTPQIEVEKAKPIVAEVGENTPAEKSGLQANDEIIKLTAPDGTTIEPKDNLDIVEFLQYNNKDITFTVLREGKLVDLKISPEKTKDGYIAGYKVFAGKYEDADTKDRLSYGVSQTTESLSQITTGIGNLTKGKGYDVLSSPLAMAARLPEMLIVDPTLFIYLIAVLSLNIGIFNLLPIPALDGGRVCLLWLDRLFKGRINKNVLNMAINVSFLLIIGLSLFVLGKDFLNLFM